MRPVLRLGTNQCFQPGLKKEQDNQQNAVWIIFNHCDIDQVLSDVFFAIAHLDRWSYPLNLVKKNGNVTGEDQIPYGPFLLHDLFFLVTTCHHCQTN